MKTYTVTLGNAELEPFGIDRAAKSRALDALEAGGLIKAERKAAVADRDIVGVTGFDRRMPPQRPASRSNDSASWPAPDEILSSGAANSVMRQVYGRGWVPDAVESQRCRVMCKSDGRIVGAAILKRNAKRHGQTLTKDRYDGRSCSSHNGGAGHDVGESPLVVGSARTNNRKLTYRKVG